MAVRLSVMVFPGTQTLPLFAAQVLGCFAARGLAVELRPAPNSEEQRAGLAAGRYQIAHGAADQCVALSETADAVIVAGGDNGFNHLVAQPEISSIAELRGRTLAADVAGTGWAFVLYEILKRHGISWADVTIREVGAPFRRFEAMRDDKAVVAAILNPPFLIRARQAGLKDLGPAAAVIGSYLGSVPYVLRSWAQDNAAALVAYLQAIVEGVRWSLDPAHEDAAIALYSEQLKQPVDIAAQTYAFATDPVNGLARDARFDAEGFKTVLRLRSEHTGKRLDALERYVDLSYFDRALAGL